MLPKDYISDQVAGFFDKSSKYRSVTNGGASILTKIPSLISSPLFNDKPPKHFYPWFPTLKTVCRISFCPTFADAFLGKRALCLYQRGNYNLIFLNGFEINF